MQISFRNMDPSPAVEAIVREKAARAGTGFDRESLKSLHALLVPLITKMKPVAEKVPDEVNTTWVKPKLVGEVKFTEWTLKGEMRHPVFLGLRTDKKATDVIRKVPKPGAGTGH